jgi:hypothetical protein
VKTPVTSEIVSVADNTYSNGITSTLKPGNPAVNAFDGNRDTNAAVATNETVMNIDLTNVSVSSTIEIRGENGFATPNCSVTVNGVTTNEGGDPDTAVDGTNGTTTKVFNVSGTLTNIKVGKITAGLTRLSQVLVDGVVLVDGINLTFNTPNPDLQYFEVGDVVQTERPEGYTLTKYNGSTNSPYPSGWVLDGNGSTRVRSRFQANLTVPVKVESTTITFYNNAQQIDEGDGEYFVIDTDGTKHVRTYAGSPGNIDLTVPAGIFIKAIGCSKNTNTNNGGNFNYIKINGSIFTLPPAPDEGGASLDPIKYVITNIDLAANTMTVDGGTWNTGETITGSELSATAADVDFLDGNSLGVSNVSGTWLPGLYAQGAEITSYAPSPQSIVFTSMNAGTTPFSGTDATLTSRTWTLEQSDFAVGPWTEVGTYIDYAANESQDGASPWADHPDLQPNQFYQVKVRYDSNNADFRESTFNTFKTGDA